MSKAQISMWEEKIVDSFAGGGGASSSTPSASTPARISKSTFIQLFIFLPSLP